jgi:hypothetical protein
MSAPPVPRNLQGSPMDEVRQVFSVPGVYLDPRSIKENTEKDPFGKAANSMGSKLDAGKAEYDMVLFSFPDALAHVDRIGKFGARKYTKGGFLEVPNGQMRYFNADIRHKLKELRGEELDPDSQELHLAHAAWNALAKLQLFLEGKGK